MFISAYKKYFIISLSLCLIGTELAFAQTKQLKEPAPAPQIAGNVDEQSSVIVNSPNGISSSYSVVIENKTNPDGKIVQTRKVWQNGQLVEEEEKTLDKDENPNGFDATIQLPNGQITHGRLFSSEDDNGFFSISPSSPFEAISQMEEQMRRQEEIMRERFNALRQQLSNSGAFQGGSLKFNSPNLSSQDSIKTSKFWIGATIERVPEVLTAQLPIENEQGVLIQFVLPDSPAAKAGLKKYDVLYKIDDRIVTTPQEVTEIIAQKGLNTVSIEYYRKGKLEKNNLTIEERPSQIQNTSPYGTLQNKNFRIVRPGVILPSSEAPNNSLNSEITKEEDKHSNSQISTKPKKESETTDKK